MTEFGLYGFSGDDKSALIIYRARGWVGLFFVDSIVSGCRVKSQSMSGECATALHEAFTNAIMDAAAWRSKHGQGADATNAELQGLLGNAARLDDVLARLLMTVSERPNFSDL